MTMAEILLDLAEAAKKPADKIVIAEEWFRGAHLARIKLALDFDRRDAGLKFRAIFEDWDQERIVREIY